MVHVDPDAAVNVHRGVGDPVSGLGCPERRGGHLDVGGHVLRQPPGGLLQREPQPFDVDVVIGQTLCDSLEAADGPVELLAGAGVVGG